MPHFFATGLEERELLNVPRQMTSTSVQNFFWEEMCEKDCIKEGVKPDMSHSFDMSIHAIKELKWFHANHTSEMNLDCRNSNAKHDISSSEAHLEQMHHDGQ